MPRELMLGHLRDYLGKMSEFMPRSLPAFVQREGREFVAAPLPGDVPRGEMKQCFSNAALLALGRHDLIYCEGYAHRIIPTLHAWCVTKEGVVIDPTWDTPETCAYFGIPIKKKFLTKMLLKNKVYGLLAEPPTATKMFESKPEIYKEVL